MILLTEESEGDFNLCNPIQETATLKYLLEKPENLTIQLMDVNGRLLKTYL